MNKRFYAVLYKTLHHFVGGVLFRTKVIRQYGGIPEGAIILASNHFSGSDILILMAASRRQIRFMAKKELFKIPLLRSLMKAMGAFPVDRGGSSVSALRRGTQLLTEGEVVGIFPQGTRCSGVHPADTSEKLHGGLGLLAQRSHAAIVPASICSRRHKIGFFKRVYVSFGRPILYEEYAPLLEKENGRLEVTKMAFAKICKLYDEAEAIINRRKTNKTKAKETEK